MALLKTSKTKLDGVLIVEPLTDFEDYRGRYIELYNEPMYQAAGIKTDFVQDDIVVSRRNVLRGIHGSTNNAKLISCLHGAFYLVVVNNILGSPQFGQWDNFTLSDRNCKQVLVPEASGTDTWYSPTLRFSIIDRRRFMTVTCSSLYRGMILGSASVGRLPGRFSLRDGG